MPTFGSDNTDRVACILPAPCPVKAPGGMVWFWNIFLQGRRGECGHSGLRGRGGREKQRECYHRTGGKCVSGCFFVCFRHVVAHVCLCFTLPRRDLTRPPPECTGLVLLYERDGCSFQMCRALGVSEVVVYMWSSGP